eukprot:CAMPEP_0183746330 /NCGR_PEP_ID=MMETSP0737-20130205/66703_1 /TAXON_ID=385413 /ORGANISM="Thalassiosira miniscula, Strain CCMP1093" /LENGTH=353 /DNA_ID=CAMNT_0025982023 /DNA_START=51 /DNA_END=1112 /DNA_ORIENTATION=-
MTSERKRSSLRTIKARIHSTILANKKLSFLLTLLLASSLLFFLSTHEPSNPYISKRYGLGAGDTNGELKTALKRKGDGRAAVAIIRVVGMNAETQAAKEGNHYNPHNDVSYLVQVKSHDYPIAPFRGTVCLLGGNANKHDETALDTLKRELNEENDVSYLVQVKSHDYPIAPFRGTVCLLGGNANKHDETALDTLKRELNEELHSPDWVDAIDPTKVIDDSSIQFTQQPMHNSSAVPHIPGTVRYLGTTLHFQSAALLSKHAPYAFMCALYEITLRPEQLPPGAIYPRGANIQEGRIVLLNEEQLRKHSKYAWGYEYTMERYFGKKTMNKQKGTAVTEVEEDTWKETPWTPTN